MLGENVNTDRIFYETLGAIELAFLEEFRQFKTCQKSSWAFPKHFLMAKIIRN